MSIFDKKASMTLQIAPCYLGNIEDGIRAQLQHLLMTCASLPSN
eukprot:SAG31_NODE_11952_length_982_cov_1.690827_1_plen_43_part_10